MHIYAPGKVTFNAFKILKLHILSVHALPRNQTNNLDSS